MCSSDFSLLPRVEAKRYNGSASFTDGVAECLLLNELSFSVDVVLVGEVPRYIYAYIFNTQWSYSGQKIAIVKRVVF